MCPVCAILLDWQYLLTSEEESFNGDLWMQEHLMGKWVSITNYDAETDWSCNQAESVEATSYQFNDRIMGC